VPEVLSQRIFFELYLSFTIHMLKTASTTQICKLTGRSLAIRGSVQHFQCAQLIELAVGYNHPGHYGFARQRAIHKLRLTILAGNTPAVVAE
jgi:hypothetical protein